VLLLPLQPLEPLGEVAEATGVTGTTGEIQTTTAEGHRFVSSVIYFSAWLLFAGLMIALC